MLILFLIGIFFDDLSCNKIDIIEKKVTENITNKTLKNKIINWYNKTSNNNSLVIQSIIEPDIELHELNWDNLVKLIDSKRYTTYEIPISFDTIYGTKVKLGVTISDSGVKGLIYKTIPDTNWFRRFYYLKKDSLANKTAEIKIYLPNKKYITSLYQVNGNFVNRETFFNRNNINYKLFKNINYGYLNCVYEQHFDNVDPDPCIDYYEDNFDGTCDGCNVCVTVTTAVVCDYQFDLDPFSSLGSPYGNFGLSYFNAQEYATWLKGGATINSTTEQIYERIRLAEYAHNFEIFEDQINYDLTVENKPCIKNLFETLKKLKNMSDKKTKLNPDPEAYARSIASMIETFNIGNPEFALWNVNIKIGNLNSDNLEKINGRTVVNYNRENGVPTKLLSSDIILDDNYIQKASDLSVVVTILHEFIHAYLYNNYFAYKKIEASSLLQAITFYQDNDSQHRTMIETYIYAMQYALMTYAYNKGYDMSNVEYYKDLCYAGLLEDDLLKNSPFDPDPATKLRIQKNIYNEQEGLNSKGTKACN